MIFAKNFARNCEKKMLGTSDAWSTSHLSQRTSKPAYYILDWWILGFHKDKVQQGVAFVHVLINFSCEKKNDWYFDQINIKIRD